MAKWGEGDPRWIVEERLDATNVNNWHWKEKNACQWSKDKLTSLFENLEINESVIAITIKELKKCEGDASANNRRSKLIFLYEWVLEIEWEGRCAGSDQVVKGKVEVPNLSDENDIDEVTIDVLLVDPTSGAIAEKIKSMMRTKGTEVIRSKLEDYVNALKFDFSKGLILPTKGGSTNTVSTKGKTSLNKTNTFHVPKPDDSKTSGVKIQTKRLEIKDQFKCTAPELYQVLTTPEMVQAFSQAPAEVVAEAGGKLTMLDSNITGKFIKVTPPTHLEFEWRFKSWPDQHFSNVVITIEQTDDSANLTLVQEGVPEYELDRTRAGWQRYYFDAIKRTFGYGAILSGGF